MSLDLKKEAFLFGNIEIGNINFRRVNLKTIESFYDNIDKNSITEDKSWPWRFTKNFKYLLDYNENKLFSNLSEFNILLDLLRKAIKFYENLLNIKKYNFLNPVSEIDFFGINIVVLLNYYRNKLSLYKRNNSEIDIDLFEEKFKEYQFENNDFVFDYVSPYDDIKWTSKWKFLSKNREITFENIDIYLDSYFKNINIYYNSSMRNNIRALNERLKFLKNHAPNYLKQLETSLPKVTEKIFNIFPYGVVYNDYRPLLDFNVFYPKLIKNADLFITQQIWLFSVLPDFLCGYLLGFPVISLDIPSNKKMLEFITKLEDLGPEKYFEFIKETYNEPYIRSISFGVETGNLKEEDNILDLCYNSITDYNQDDIACLFNENVIHYFTSKEFRTILKKQENPYNRQFFPNISKVIENLKFKNNVKKNLNGRGLDLDLDGTMEENLEEMKKKIASKNIIHYFPHIESHTDNFYRPLLQILLQNM